VSTPANGAPRPRQAIDGPKTQRELEGARAAEAVATRRTRNAREREQAQAERVRALQDDNIRRPTRTLQLRLERDRDLGRSAER
jgi:hypothetical protein